MPYTTTLINIVTKKLICLETKLKSRGLILRSTRKMIDERNFDLSKLTDYQRKYYEKRIAYGCTPDEAKRRLIDFDKWCDDHIRRCEERREKMHNV